MLVASAVKQRTECYSGDVKLAPLALVLILPAGHAATVEVTVKDARGAPVVDAVVWAIPKAGPAPFRNREAAIAQRDKTFVPLVTVVQTGTAVKFPNQDPIRHHVYSFSTPKTFELKLYAGTPAAPVVFDKPGEVVLGCNIHDQMIAYVYVVDTPWYAKTAADGSAKLDGLPAGEYDLRVIHYAQAAPQAPVPIRLRADETLAAPLSVALNPTAPRMPAK
jgi:plastocyanin